MNGYRMKDDGEKKPILFIPGGMYRCSLVAVMMGCRLTVLRLTTDQVGR